MICEQGGFVEVSKISSQDRVLERTVEQTLDESCVPRGRLQQRTAKQYGDLTKEFEALFNQQTVIEIIIDSRNREAENNKKVTEKEWLDLMHFLRSRLTDIKEQLVFL